MSKSAGMKALVVRQLGNPVPSPSEKKPYAVVGDHPTPQYLAPNAVRIKVAASGLNFADALQVMVSSIHHGMSCDVGGIACLLQTCAMSRVNTK